MQWGEVNLSTTCLTMSMTIQVKQILTDTCLFQSEVAHILFLIYIYVFYGEDFKCDKLFCISASLFISSYNCATNILKYWYLIFDVIINIKTYKTAQIIKKMYLFDLLSTPSVFLLTSHFHRKASNLVEIVSSLNYFPNLILGLGHLYIKE